MLWQQQQQQRHSSDRFLSVEAYVGAMPGAENWTRIVPSAHVSVTKVRNASDP
jgi:hypothetical protein